MENNEQILVRPVDGADGILIIDPNAVRKDNEIKPRYVGQENLMIYVEVRAFMNPKTKYLDYNDADADSDKIINITKGMFYSSTQATNNDGTTKDKLTTDWTEMYDQNREKDVEGFGINNIDIEFNASLMPKIHIEFIDVRGKNLLERGGQADNPYNVFYTMPYPLFELVVKGYYGKAIRMPMFLEKAITKFDPTTASYVISADFKSSTFAILNDLILLYALIVPYMYPIPVDKQASAGASFEGQQIIKEIYDQIERDKRGQKKVNETNTSNEPARDRIELLELFTYDERLAKVFGGDYSDKILERNDMLNNIINEIINLREKTQFIAKEVQGFPKQKQNISKLIIETKRMINGFYERIEALGYSELEEWNETRKDIIKSATFIDVNKQEIVPLLETSDNYKSLIEPVIKFRAEQNSKDILTTKEKLKQLRFNPTIENTVKSIIVHLDAFMELLKRKTEQFAIPKEITNNTIHPLDIKSGLKDACECIKVKNGNYRRLPWSEYYSVVKKNNQEVISNNEDVLDNDPNFVKDYPGNADSNEIRNWGEVGFIDEMYAARARLTTKVGLQLGTNTTGNEIFITTPLEVPIYNERFSIEDTVPTTLNRTLSKILLMIYHNGMLFRQTHEADRRGADGAYRYFIKYMLSIIFPTDDLSEKDVEYLNLMKRQMAGLTEDNIRKYLQDNIKKINEIINPLLENQDNLFISEPHSYYIKDDALPTKVIRENYFLTENTNGEHSTTYQVSPRGLPYHPKDIEVLKLFDFNTQTKFSRNDKTKTKALIFTNNYINDDMFITKR